MSSEKLIGFLINAFSKENSGSEQQIDNSNRKSKINDDLKQYARSIKQFADNKDKFKFSNSGKLHARIVMANIFRTAENSVCVFAKNLQGEVSQGEYLEQLNTYLEANKGTFKLLLETNPKNIENSKALKKILEYKEKSDNKIEVRYLENFKLSDFFGGEVRHITIADDRMYREEIDVNEFIANVSFNDPVKTSQLSNQFNFLWNEATSF